MFSRLTRLWAKNPASKYPAMQDMLRVFLSNHHDDFGTTIEEMMANYINYDMPIQEVQKEISALLQIEDDNGLSSIMSEIAEDHFHPEHWGETWRSFLKKTQTTLSK